MSVLKATFGGGCFWGMEKLYRKHFPKLRKVQVGYMGGKLDDPSYEDVCSGMTGHAEVVHMEYDPSEVAYRDLLTLFWRCHNPTTLNRQGNDKGTQYRSAVFYYSSDQKKEAEAVKEEVKGKWKDPIVTEITDASSLQFWPAEEYHQKYLERNPDGYCNHRLYW